MHNLLLNYRSVTDNLLSQRLYLWQTILGKPSSVYLVSSCAALRQMELALLCLVMSL